MQASSTSTAIPPPKTANGPRPIKRRRRSRADIETISAALYNTLWEDHPMTVRQVFYQLVSKGVIEKSEAEYKGTVIRLLGDMRRDGRIPFHWIADNTRWMRKPDTHSGLEHCLKLTTQFYRRAIWDNQPEYVEIWLEKDALSGVLYEVTEEWDVPLMVTRGYPSLSFLHDAAETIEAEDKPANLYYFGDRDPSGVDIPRAVEASLREFAPNSEIEFHRLAVTPYQVYEWGLPTRPTKTTDSRSKNFYGESVEVDAIPPSKLRELVRECIEGNIDKELLARTAAVEQAERETLQRLTDSLSAEGSK